MRVVAASADQCLFSLKPVGTAFIEEVDDAFCLGHDFGADPVAGKKKQIVSGHSYASLQNDIERGSGRAFLVKKVTRAEPGNDVEKEC